MAAARYSQYDGLAASFGVGPAMRLDPNIDKCRQQQAAVLKVRSRQSACCIFQLCLHSKEHQMRGSKYTAVQWQ